MTDPGLSRRERLALAAATLAYAALLLYRFRTVPDGLVNDQAEELLRGLILVRERRLEVLTLVVGNSAETLWLYVLGVSATLLGPSVFALLLPTALAAAATAWLTARFFVERRPGTPWWIPFLLAAGSPWLFHYGRSGFRAITAPLFVALAALLLQRAQARTDRPWPYAAVGAVVGLSLYGYTANRLLPMALAAAFAFVLAREREGRRPRFRCALACAAGFAVVSIPNFVFFVKHPVEFLVRGGYSVIGDVHGKLLNVLATVGLPLYYPYRYRFVWGEAHVLDGFSASMTGSGVDPVPVAVGLLAVLGLVVTLRRGRDLAALFLVATHALTIVFLGPLGPSLTRVLLLVPVFVFYASVGTLELARTPRARTVAGVVLALVAAVSLGTYFRRLSDPAASGAGVRGRRPDRDGRARPRARGVRPARRGGFRQRERRAHPGVGDGDVGRRVPPPSLRRAGGPGRSSRPGRCSSRRTPSSIPGTRRASPRRRRRTRAGAS